MCDATQRVRNVCAVRGVEVRILRADCIGTQDDSSSLNLRELIAFEDADGAAEGRKFYFREAVADGAEKALCVFRSAAAETVGVGFEERFGAIVHSAGRRLRIQIERVGAGKAHFHQATAALHGVNTGVNEIPVEENVAGGGSQIYPGQ